MGPRVTGWGLKSVEGRTQAQAQTQAKSERERDV